MEAYLFEWLNFLGRWIHLITGVTWIGASFHFIWLDSQLEPPKDEESKQLGIGGEVWAVHGGGFYRAQKFTLTPPELPQSLHWFKWEAYSTWLSGIFLLCLIYYVSAEVYLIDKSVADLSKGAAIGIGLGVLVGGWGTYDLLCRSPLKKSEPMLALALLLMLTALAYALTHLFSGRGAFIHFGAVLGTIMSANVLTVIIPGQKALVRAKQQGRTPDAAPGLRGKQRSIHNTYFTLPVMFVMISNHYAFMTNAKQSWLVLILISLAGALIRLFFVRRNHGRFQPALAIVGCVLIAAVIAMLAPRGGAEISSNAVSFARVQAIVQTRCSGCHRENPTFVGLASPPKGILLDTPERILAQRLNIHQQTVVSKAMPISNLTQITDAERAMIDAWLRGGAEGKR